MTNNHYIGEQHLFIAAKSIIGHPDIMNRVQLHFNQPVEHSVVSCMTTKYVTNRQWVISGTMAYIFTNCISTGGNAIAPSAVHLLPLYLLNRLTFDLDLLHVYGSWPQLSWNWRSRSSIRSMVNGIYINNCDWGQFSSLTCPEAVGIFCTPTQNSAESS